MTAEDLAAALLAAIGERRDGYYVFGTLDGVAPGEREDLTDVGLDGSDDLVAICARALEIVASGGVAWVPHPHSGVLEATAPETPQKPSESA